MNKPDAVPPERKDDDGQQKSRGKKPIPGNNNTFWWLMLGVVMAAVIVSWVNGRKQGTQVGYRKFTKAVETGELNSSNVHQLKIGTSYIRFSDQPAATDEADDGTTTAEGDGPFTEKVADESTTAKQYIIPVVGMKDETQAAFVQLLERNGIDYTFDTTPSPWLEIVTFVAIPLLLICVLLIMLRRLGGAGSAMSFGRSRGKLLAQEDLGVTFNDVAGVEEGVEELREIVEFLRTPTKYQALGGRIPRGVLLVGPPGTGKTLLAKAVAGEAGVPFFSLSGSDFVEMFVGVGAARVRDMFQQAVQRSPAIIFIDELDALGKTRGSGLSGGHDEREQTLNALLVEMDGFGSDQSVIVIGATNRPETLDPALMRPGRFDRHVLVDRPDIKGREAILKVHAARVRMDDGVDLKRVAKLTPGFVGADLANLINEAALLAARANKTQVSMIECEEAMERVVAGLEKQTRIISEDEKIRVAYHECGHALVASCLPLVDPVHKISIIPRGLGALGYMMQRPEEDRQLHTKSELNNRICVMLGGIAAEDIFFQENSTGASNDLQRATDLARRMVTEFGMSPKLGRVNYHEGTRSPFVGSGSPAEYAHSEETIREIDLEVRRLIDQAYATSYDVIDTRKELMERLAKELLDIEVMDSDHLAGILAEFKTGPAIKPGTFASKPPITSSPEPRPAETQSDDAESSAESAGEGA